MSRASVIKLHNSTNNKLLQKPKRQVTVSA